jgi:putative membrane protein
VPENLNAIPAEDPRVRFAAERTLLAWIRTGLALMGFGFLVARFGLFLRELALGHAEPPQTSTAVSLWIGTALVVVGVVVQVLAAVQHAQILRHLDHRVPYQAPRLSLGLAVAGVLAILGAAMVVYLQLLGS